VNVTVDAPLSSVQLVPVHVAPDMPDAVTLPPVPAVAETTTVATKFAVHAFAAVGFVNVIALPVCVKPVQPVQLPNRKFGLGVGMNVTVDAPLSSVHVVPPQLPPVTAEAATEPPAPAVAETTTVAVKVAVHVVDAVGFVIVIAALVDEEHPDQPVKR
jgi:hypothetical protein